MKIEKCSKTSQLASCIDCGWDGDGMSENNIHQKAKNHAKRYNHCVVIETARAIHYDARGSQSNENTQTTSK